MEVLAEIQLVDRYHSKGPGHDVNLQRKYLKSSFLSLKYTFISGVKIVGFLGIKEDLWREFLWWELHCEWALSSPREGWVTPGFVSSLMRGTLMALPRFPGPPLNGRSGGPSGFVSDSFWVSLERVRAGLANCWWMVLGWCLCGITLCQGKGARGFAKGWMTACVWKSWVPSSTGFWE